MKKLGLPALLTAGMALILVLCLYVQKKSEPEQNPISFLSFRVFSDESPDLSEEILCWNQDEERCFVFLPSYGDLKRTEVQLLESQNYKLVGVQHTQ